MFKRGEYMLKQRYTREFKIQAVKLVIEEDFSVKEISEQIGIHPNSLYRWISEYEIHGSLAFPGKGSKDFIYQNKLKQLELENEKLRTELEILKKFRVFLKKSPK